MLPSLRYFIPFLLITLMGLTGCDSEKKELSRAVPVESWLPLMIDEVPLKVQVALTLQEQRKGLMYRDFLPADSGMIFPYPEAKGMTFYMRNTEIPLDIAFFNSAGELLEIHRMYPYDTQQTRSRSQEINYAIEMNSGWFASKGLLPGARLNLDLLADCLRKRGADPADFNLPPASDN